MTVRRKGEKARLRQIVTDCLTEKFNPKEIAFYFNRNVAFIYRLVRIRDFKAKQKQFYP